MENYNSEEEKARHQRGVERLEKIRAFLSNKEEVEQVNLTITELTEFVMDIRQRALDGEFVSDEEKELLAQAGERIQQAMKAFQDMRLELGDSLYKQSVAYFYNVKERAEAGDEEAKAIYERLLPGFQKSLLGGSGLN